MFLIFSAIYILLICMICIGVYLPINGKYSYWCGDYGRIVLLAFSAICLLSLFGKELYTGYIRSIPTVSENNDIIHDYAPFESDSEIAVLSEESSLKITEDFPRVDGSSSFYPVYSSFVNATYKVADKSNISEFIKCSETSDAYKNIVDGDADVIFASAPSKDQEEYAKDKGVKLIYTPIGKEAFVFFVNSKNPLENITVGQIQKIYSGEITNWNELNISGFGEIRAFQREDGSESQSTLLRLMGDEDLISSPVEDVIGEKGSIIRKTSDYRNHKNAIGFSFRFYSMEMLKNNKIKLLNIGGVEPTANNIENSIYPLSSHFYAVTRSERDTNTEELINWILGEQGQNLIELTGYFPLY